MAKAQNLIEAGGIWHDDPGGAAAIADIIITMVGLPSDVEQLYLQKGGAAKDAPKQRAHRNDDLHVIASGPHRSGGGDKRLACVGRSCLQWPPGAVNAKLSIMVGGDAAMFAKVRPALELMGSNIVL